MSTKRRRILDEDDSDVDDESKNPSLTTTTSSSGNTTTTSDNKSANNEHNDDDEKAKNTVMRMLRNTKKSNVKVQLNKPSLPLPDSDDKKVGTVSIPRKATAQIPTTIPKRGRDEIPKKSKAIDDKDSNSTLLSLSMLPMPSSAVPQSQSQKPLTLSSVSGLSTGSTSVTGTTGTAAPSRPNTTPPPPPIAAAAAPATSASATMMPINESMATTRRPKPPATTTRPPDYRLGQLSPVRMDVIDTGVPSGQVSSFQHQQQQSSSSNAPQPPPTRLKDEEKRVLNTLKTLCSKVNVQLQPTDDLLSGSFVREPTTAAVEFDQDDERRIPIFPEDFTQGQPMWPLSWWGIVDPILNTTNDEGATTTGTVLATSSTAGGSAKQRHNNTASAIQKVMDKTKQLVEGSIPATPHETEATPTSAPTTTTGHDDYNNPDRHRDHYHHSSDRRSRGDRSDHDRRRHDDSDRRRRRSRHDHDGVGDGDGRRLDGDDRRADGPPPYNWDQSNPSSDRRMGHPRHPPPGVSRSPPRDPGHSRRGPPPRY